MNIADLIICGILAALLAAAVVYIIRKRKKGGCNGCGGDCENCAKK